MDRLDVIQTIIDAKKARTYLEIGVAKGLCFFRIWAPKKIAVDPQFIFSKKKRYREYIKNFSNFTADYYEMTSDDFFKRNHDLLKNMGIDVAFIDGLHTHEQSLKDVMNTLDCLNDNGLVIMHDCNPENEAAAQPALSYEDAKMNNPSDWDGPWSGDVWKTIPHLRAQRDDLEIFVLDCDHGLGIISRNTPTEKLNNSINEIKSFTYKDFEKDRKHLINLKPPEYLEEFLNPYSR